MKKAVRGALWSGLVFPGFGQLLLQRRLRGVILIVATSSAVSVLAERILVRAFAALEESAACGEPLDMITIVSALRSTVALADNLFVRLLILLVALLWAFAIIDAFIIGRRKDIEEARVQAPTPSENPGPPAAHPQA